MHLIKQIKHIKNGIVVCLLLSSFSGIGQDVHFSQYYRAPLLVNPALTGVFPGNHRAMLNYRDQWAGVAPFKTYGLAYDASILKAKLSNKYLGVGLMALKDEAGDTHLSTTQVNISVSSVITINSDQNISAGIQGGFAQRSVDAGALQWGAEYEENIGYQAIPGVGIDYENFSYGDFSAGLAWSYSSGETNMTSNDQLSITAGVALYHLNQPAQLFDEETLHQQMVAHAGASIGIKNTNLAFAPSVLYLRQGPLTEINVGGLIRYTLRAESRHTGLLKEKALYLGSYYRVGDALIPTLILEIAGYSVGFSYDLNLSALKAATKGQGGFELSLRYIAPNSSKSGKYRHKSLI